MKSAGQTRLQKQNKREISSQSPQNAISAKYKHLICCINTHQIMCENIVRYKYIFTMNHQSDTI